MKKLIVFFAIMMLCSGCASSTRLTRLKNRGENVATVEVKGNISKAKELVREVAKELKLIERQSAETDNFMIVDTNRLKGGVINVVSGGFGYAAYMTKLGFFFDYNKENDITTVTIAEEVSSFGDPRRFIFTDKIKLKQLEPNK